MAKDGARNEYGNNVIKPLQNSSQSSCRMAPNSARKRRPIPDLSRPSASPCHGAKMSMIFQDASVRLQGFRTPPQRPTSNIKRSRQPFTQPDAGRPVSGRRDANHVLHNIETPSKTFADQELQCDIESISQETRPTHDSEPDSSPAARPMRPTSANPEAQSPHSLPHLPTLSISFPLSAFISPSSKKDELEPISSGFTTPSAQCDRPPTTPDEVKYPEFGPWQVPRSLPSRSAHVPSSDKVSGDEYYEPIFPEPSSDAVAAQVTQIETWLDGVPDDGTSGAQHSRISKASNYVPLSSKRSLTITPALKKDSTTRTMALCNKENISPSESLCSPVRGSNQCISSTHRRLHDAYPYSRDVNQSLLPIGHLNQPPRRKKARTNLEPTAQASTTKDFTIHEDQLVDALANLSPDVERHRKSRRPRRERCVSYWDDDILSPESSCHPSANPPSSPMDVDVGKSLRKGREVLGESSMSNELCTEKPFIDEAEDAGFDFYA